MSAFKELDFSGLTAAPVYVFTTDIDWAPEWAIREMLRVFDRFEVPLSPFLTHDSHILKERYGTSEMKRRAGVHPNFFPKSSHGGTTEHVVEYVGNLWPDAIGFRSHCFFDNTHVTNAFAAKGFKYDSNVCLYLQPGAVPLYHNSGMLRFPVFWEDDVHFARGQPFKLDAVREHFDRPGLKVINVHPFIIALNTPDADFYNANKHLYRNHDEAVWKKSVAAGAGAQTFLVELLEHVRKKGCRAVYLNDLYQELTGEKKAAVATVSAGKTSEVVGEKVKVYEQLSADERAKSVMDVYNKRDTSKPYATSPDFNLRELEIGFVARHLKGGKVLDLGCGNGYTMLSLAKKIPADYTGLDFSEKMLEGARKLAEQYAGELKCVPKWVQGDVRKLDFPTDTFDYVISERCLQNLPNKEDQFQAARDIHRVLKPGGVYLMVEGTDSGLSRLNKVREKMGLPIIPPVSEDNVSALRFDEDEINGFLEKLFDIEIMQHFGTYYLISRVVHPLLVAPDKPKFDSKINAIARQVAEIIPDIGRLGHVMGYKLRARK